MVANGILGTLYYRVILCLCKFITKCFICIKQYAVKFSYLFILTTCLGTVLPSSGEISIFLSQILVRVICSSCSYY